MGVGGWGGGGGVGYVSVVIVVGGVASSLIAVKGMFLLGSGGAFVWARSIIHPVHSRLRGSGGGVAYNVGSELTSNGGTSLSLPLRSLAPFPPPSVLPSVDALQRSRPPENMAVIPGVRVPSMFQVG